MLKIDLTFTHQTTIARAYPMTVSEFKARLEQLVNQAVQEEKDTDGTWIEVCLCEHVSNTTLGLVLRGRMAPTNDYRA